jgi:hypothetical protein
MNRVAALIALLALACQSHSAGPAPEVDRGPDAAAAEVAPEQAWLLELVGNWESTAEVVMGPDQAPSQLHGRESIRALGTNWIVAEIEGEAPGGGIFSALMTLGFDSERKRFQGTWVDSAMSYLWTYDGSLDAARKVLTLESRGPDWNDPSKTMLYRDSIELVDDDHKIQRSSAQNSDGTWTTFLTARYRRE